MENRQESRRGLLFRRRRHRRESCRQPRLWCHYRQDHFPCSKSRQLRRSVGGTNNGATNRSWAATHPYTPRQRPNALPPHAAARTHPPRHPTPQVYLIPRSDGRLLVGATVEEAGFDKRTDLATIQRLHQVRDRPGPKTRRRQNSRRLGRPPPRHSRRTPHPRRHRNPRLLRRHRPLPRRHPSCADHRRNHG